MAKQGRKVRKAIWTRVRWWLVLAYLAVFGAGAVAFIAGDTPMPLTPAFETLSPIPGSPDPTVSPTVTEPAAEAVQQPVPPRRVNWASLWSGGRVRASIWDYFRNHHPLYLIDGQPQPTEMEKWASLAQQPTPWLEILLDGRHDLDQIVLFHAGWRESSDLTNDRYLIRCYRGETLVAELGVRNNTEPIARHPLSCLETDRVWVAFDCAARSLEVARIYEIEAWGTP